MDNIVGKAVIGARLASRQLDALANDLANVNTAGYKESVFATLLADAFSLDDPDARGSLVDDGKALVPTGTLDLTQGSLTGTGRPLDFALDGPGFFVVQTPQGPRYTRGGQFGLSDQGVLVTKQGFPVVGENGPISVPAGRLASGEDGTVYVDESPIAKLRVVDFADPEKLRKAGGTLLEYLGEEPPAPAEGAKVLGERIEQSNVDMVGGMIQMISIQRAYEAYRRLLDANQTMNEQGTSVLGKVTA